MSSLLNIKFVGHTNFSICIKNDNQVIIFAFYLHAVCTTRNYSSSKEVKKNSVLKDYFYDVFSLTKNLFVLNTRKTYSFLSNSNYYNLLITNLILFSARNSATLYFLFHFFNPPQNSIVIFSIKPSLTKNELFRTFCKSRSCYQDSLVNILSIMC